MRRNFCYIAMALLVALTAQAGNSFSAQTTTVESSSSIRSSPFESFVIPDIDSIQSKWEYPPSKTRLFKQHTQLIRLDPPEIDPQMTLDPDVSVPRMRFTLPPPLPNGPAKTFPSQIPGRKLILFDLDETLWSARSGGIPGAQVINAPPHQFHVKFRPGLIEFLKRCKGHYNIGVFTAASQSYADAVLAYIDPEAALIPLDMRLYGPSTSGKRYAKHLAGLGFDLRSTILVDNNPHSFAMDMAVIETEHGRRWALPTNGIAVLDFTGAANEVYPHIFRDELVLLEKFLDGLAGPDVVDVRPHLMSWNYRHGKVNPHRYSQSTSK